MNEAERLLKSAAAGASYNMLLQLSFRVMTFLMNAYVLRHISGELLGVVNVRLTLLYTTILFVSREAFRKACLTKSTGRIQWRQTINLLWCTVPLGVVMAIGLSVIWVFVLEQPSTDHYLWGVLAYSLAAVLELCTEPLWVIGQTFLYVRLKVAIEAAAVFVRCVVTVVLLILIPQWGLKTFIIAHLAFTAVYVVLYFVPFAHHVMSVEFQRRHDDLTLSSWFDLFPRFHPSQSFIDIERARLALSFFYQSFLKQILTEGERYVMTLFAILSFGEQGIYDVINNLGSLVARFIFQPVEESFYLFFAQTLQRGVPYYQQTQFSRHVASETLFVLFKFASLIGCTILVFGKSYSYLLLHLYGGDKLTEGSGPNLLSWYCVYVLVIALNGVTECFVFATMSKQEVDKYNHLMVGFSLLFLFSALFFTRLVGSVGFIWANCFNMLARIAHSVYFIYGYYSGTGQLPLKGLFPSWQVLVSLLISFIITTQSERYFCCNIQLHIVYHVAIGAACLAVTAGSIFIGEKQFIQFAMKRLLHKQN